MKMKPVLESAYICIEDMERAVAFYQWFLDRRAVKKGDSMYMFDIDGFRLFLFDHNRENEAVSYGDNCLLSFEVDDAEEMEKKLLKKGLKIVFPLKEIIDNIVFEFEDPEGNHIELFSGIKS